METIENWSKHAKVPKTLKEDILWAYEIISQNKLYKEELDNYKLSKDRDEVKVWLDMINLNNLPRSKLDIDNLPSKKSDIIPLRRGVTSQNINKHKEFQLIKDPLEKRGSTKKLKVHMKDKRFGDDSKDEKLEFEFYQLIEIAE